MISGDLGQCLYNALLKYSKNTDNSYISDKREKFDTVGINGVFNLYEVADILKDMLI